MIDLLKQEANVDLYGDQNNQALQVMLMVLDKKSLPNQWVLDWFVRFEKQIAFQYAPVTILQYSAVYYLFKEQYFLASDLAQANKRLIQALKKAREFLTGDKFESGDESQIHQPLPTRVLRLASRDEVLYHQSLYNNGIHKFRDTVRIIWQNYIPRSKDVLFFVAAVGLLIFSVSFVWLVIGAILGYIFSSAMEYLVHRFIGHAKSRDKKILLRLGPVGRDMLDFNIEHSIHHGSVQQNYTEVFAPYSFKNREDLRVRDFQKSKVDQFVYNKGGEALLAKVHSSNYGLSSSNIYRTQLFFLPLSIIFSFIFCGLIKVFSWIVGISDLVQVGLFYHLGFLLFSQLWILTSSSYHPFLHMSEERVDAEAPWYWKYFLKTRLSRFISLTHRMHHVHGGSLNQNLNIGFDFLFSWSPITWPELVDMKKRKMIC